MRLGERPSIVVTALPCTADAGMRQENMRSPSMCTMQAPHWPAPQPNFVPVSFSSSRSTHRRRVRSGALTLTGLPLTLKLIAISTPCAGVRGGPGAGSDAVRVRSHATPHANSRSMLRCAVSAGPCLSRPVWVSVTLTAQAAAPVREGCTSRSIAARGNHHDTHALNALPHRRFAAGRRNGRGVPGENAVPAVAGVLAGRRHRRREDRLGRGTDRDSRQRRPRYLEQLRGAGEAGVLADGPDHEARRRQPRQHRAGDGVHQGAALRRPLRRDAQGLLPERQLSGERAHHGDQLRAAGHRDRDPVGRRDRRPLLERPSLLGRRPGEEEIDWTENTMRSISRREFLAGAAAGGTLLGLGAGALAQSDKFDLIIKGGEVLDPGQKLRARRDVGIRNAVIAALEPEIPDARAKQMLDARGKLVLPGLIDMHAHVYPQVSAIGLPADELVAYTATTTYVSAGDAGANTFSALKHYIVAQARSRIYAFVHISSIGLSGFPVGEMLNIDYADVDQAAKTLAENPELVLGVKVRETVEVVG